MTQIKFNDDFDTFIEDTIKYWKSIDEVPDRMKEFIRTTSDSRVLYDETTSQYYCSKCLKTLDQNHRCKSCDKVYTLNDYGNKKMMNCNIKNMKDYLEDVCYYVFDIVGEKVLLYVLKENICYNNPLTVEPYKTSKVTIEKVYQVFSDKVIDLKNNKTFYYSEVKKIIESFDFSDESTNEEEIYFEFEFTESEVVFLFTENLEQLKNVNFYKYTNLWNFKQQFNNNTFTLSELTIYPIYYKQFEYLIKMELYNLARTPYVINYQKSFKNTFGVDKKYYEFMKKIDITSSQLYALQSYPTTDASLLNFICDHLWVINKLSQYTSIMKIKNYFEEQEISKNHLHEYYDYIRCCEEMKLDFKDNDVLFPKDFMKQHDKITEEMIIAKNPEVDKNIKTLSRLLTLNQYEDDKYVIFPADSVEILVDESSQQSNCVRTYCDMISNNECQIYFMRLKNNIKQSFVTIEVRDGKIVQAKTKFNQEPSEEIMKILNKWEKQIIPVIKPNDNVDELI